MWNTHSIEVGSLRIRPLANLQRISEEVSHHVLGGTVIGPYLLVLHPVHHEEVSDVHMSGPLPAGCSAIFLKQYTAMVVLIHNTIVTCIPLGL